jgi:hydroxyacylglutathione hydrolase
LLTDTPASEEPVMLFTGDFVFVGDVGRPDLLEKPQESKERRMVPNKCINRLINLMHIT